MYVFLAGLGGFTAGAIGGFALTLTVYILFAVQTGYYDREGATAMDVAFRYAPGAALVCGAVAAFIGVRTARQKAAWRARRRRMRLSRRRRAQREDAGS